jgi:hypothetical protein
MEKQGTNAINGLPPNPPFTNTGLDFCGPFDVRTSKFGKTKTTFKYFAAIFICMYTKAIHIELINDLTYEVFRVPIHDSRQEEAPLPPYILTTARRS